MFSLEPVLTLLSGFFYSNFFLFCLPGFDIADRRRRFPLGALENVGGFSAKIFGIYLHLRQVPAYDRRKLDSIDEPISRQSEFVLLWSKIGHWVVCESEEPSCLLTFVSPNLRVS